MQNADSKPTSNHGLDISKPFRQFVIISVIGMTLMLVLLVYTHLELSREYLREHLDSHNKNLSIVLRNSLLADGVEQEQTKVTEWVRASSI